VDTGIMEGSEISMFYDPMIAKLVTRGFDRPQAIETMLDALDEYVIRGVRHNICFLAALISHPKFQRGEISTGFIDEEFPDGFDDTDIPVDDPALPIVVAGIIHRLYMDRAARISGQLAGHERRVQDSWVVIVGEKHHAITVKPFQADCCYRVDYEGEQYRVQTDWLFCQKLFRGSINGNRFCFQVQRDGIGYRLVHRGRQTEALVLTPMAANLYRLMPQKSAADLSGLLLSPMPGLLVKLHVEVGQEVQAGEELAVIEAMKMENVLRAANDGVISKIVTCQGDCLTVDQVILEFEN
jgi:propionyl-CoA carboxylase alpha chain